MTICWNALKEDIIKEKEIKLALKTEQEKHLLETLNNSKFSKNDLC
jgi:hypothetical protein